MKAGISHTRTERPISHSLSEPPQGYAKTRCKGAGLGALTRSVTRSSMDTAEARAMQAKNAGSALRTERRMARGRPPAATLWLRQRRADILEGPLGSSKEQSTAAAPACRRTCAPHGDHHCLGGAVQHDQVGKNAAGHIGVRGVQHVGGLGACSGGGRGTIARCRTTQQSLEPGMIWSRTRCSADCQFAPL